MMEMALDTQEIAGTGSERAQPGTRSRILDAAERMVQARGFNAFSYADIAEELGVTKASLHYHFPSKAGLGVALIERYSERFAAALDDIDARETDAPGKLDAYAAMFADVLREGRMCLCGMLAAEHETLAEPIRAGVLAFLDDNERWLEAVLREGREQRGLRFEGTPTDIARSIVSGLEGAMLVARSYDDVERFQTSADTLFAGVAGIGQAA
jgi:TetR/AcrR family transcriptional regulator, transcriptional repressor for nem operon